MPLPEVTRTVYLEVFDAPECWVRYKTIYGLTQNELEVFNSVVSDKMSDTEKVKVRFCLLIEEWKITNPRTGEDFKQLKDNPDEFDLIPNYLTSFILGEVEQDSVEFNKRLDQGEVLPLASESGTD